jgi:REP element-mobilizing transposase RayT
MEGGLYHVIVRGLERHAIFKSPKDYREFLDRLGKNLEKHQCECYAWALLSNHAHLLLSPKEKTLSALLRCVLTGYAVYFNRRYNRAGHLFQNRFKSILCQEDNYFLELIRYIHLNPLRAGVVANSEELDRYPWTGHKAILGKSGWKWQNTTKVLEMFGKSKERAVHEYRAFIGAGNDKGQPEYEGGGLRRSAGGWEKVRELGKTGEFWTGDERILGEGDFVTETLKKSMTQMNLNEKMQSQGWSLEKIADEVCRFYRVAGEDLNRKWRVSPAGKAKALVAYLGKEKLALSSKELSGYLNVGKSGLSYLIRRGEQIWNEKGVNWSFELRPQ